MTDQQPIDIGALVTAIDPARDEAATVVELRAELTDLTDEELAARQQGLSQLRTVVRLHQNAATAEAEIRTAMEGMSSSTRKVLRQQVDGSIAATGEASA